MAGDRQKTKFVKINLFFKALQAPIGGDGRFGDWVGWSQFGVLHGVVRSGAEEDNLSLRGVRGKQMDGSLSSIVFVGDYGKMVMVRTEDKISQGSMFLPGETFSTQHTHTQT